MILDIMRQGKTPMPDLPNQDTIFTTGWDKNQVQTGLWVDELDPWGVDDALDSLDPWSPGYNFGVSTYDITPAGFNDYLKDMARWIAYDVSSSNDPNVVEKYIPVCAPKYGSNTAGVYKWVAVNGVAASLDPYNNYANPYTLYGMWITDPENPPIIGRDQYVLASQLETILEPSPPDPKKYVSVVEPPEGPEGDMTIAEPEINDSTLALTEIARHASRGNSIEKHMIDSALVVDLKTDNGLVRYSVDGELLNLFKPENSSASASLSWREIIPSALLADGEFAKAIDNSIAREFMYVTRIDTGEEYILIPFDKFVAGQFLSYAAIMVDKESGYFKQASWVTEPTRYVQVSEEEAITKVIDLYPDSASKEIKARLIWKPGELSTSPFYPFWEVTAGEDVYYVIEK